MPGEAGSAWVPVCASQQGVGAQGHVVQQGGHVMCISGDPQPLLVMRDMWPLAA